MRGIILQVKSQEVTLKDFLWQSGIILQKSLNFGAGLKFLYYFDMTQNNRNAELRNCV